MVVRQIHIACMPALETEDNAPVALHCNAPETFPVALEGMKPEAGQTHVLGDASAVEHSQDVFHLPNVIGADCLRLVLLEQPFESFVPKTLDHCLTVT